MVALIALSAGAAPVRGDIYMYKDSRGVLHFSNAPARKEFRFFMHEGPRMALKGFKDPARARVFDPIIHAAARRYGVDASLIKAVIRAESDFVPEARSPKGAQGLMQLMPATARLHGVDHAYDPAQNVDGGVRHLRLLLDRYGGNLRLALAAYNAGSGAVENYGGVPPYAETWQYLERVMRFREMYKSAGG